GGDTIRPPCSGGRLDGGSVAVAGATPPLGDGTVPSRHLPSLGGSPCRTHASTRHDRGCNLPARTFGAARPRHGNQQLSMRSAWGAARARNLVPRALRASVGNANLNHTDKTGPTPFYSGAYSWRDNL